MRAKCVASRVFSRSAPAAQKPLANRCHSVKRRHPAARRCVVALGLVLACGCKQSASKREQAADPALSAVATGAPTSEPPRLLYIPSAQPSEASFGPPPPALPFDSRCPPDMVSIRGQFCIDRFEAALVDADKSRPLSPFFHPTPERTRSAFEDWQRLRFTMGEPAVQLLPVPAPPAFQLSESFEPKATSVRGVTPSGYLSGLVAELACKRAGKRLCREEEWVMACRGERDTAFPYGPVYEPGKCNVKNGQHPARILHGNAGVGHWDPRLNQVQVDGQSLLHVTGSHPECVSRWGADGVWDMVGNLDEWIDDPAGVFLGGFYARNTEAGCAARISVHPRPYYDYSLGVRCCL